MRHGLLVANVGSHADPRRLAELAATAEASGWEALLVWDHLGWVWDGPAGDPWIMLAAAAAASERLLLGTGVTPVPRRRLQVLATQVATLDALAPGRLIFGAGIGGNEREFTAFGEDFDARRRGAILDEGLDLLRRLWAGERVEHRGEHYVVDGVQLSPTPGRVPIWIGGNSAPALRRAARFDCWFADTAWKDELTMSPEELAAKVELIGAPVDVAVHGNSEPGDTELRASYERAGATWWLEGLHDQRGPFETSLARVAAGR